MPKILALDIATSLGWAVFDTDRHESSIECGAISLKQPDGMTAVARRRLMRIDIDVRVCKLISQYRPDVACLEQPLNFVGDPAAVRKKGPRGQKSFGIAIPEMSMPQKKEKGGGPNANTAFMLNQIFAVADTVCRHKCKHLVIEVAPTSWQTITKSYPGDTKSRSIAFCKAFRIPIPPTLNKGEQGDAADAACIAVWAKGHAQELKLLSMAGEAKLL